MLLSLKQHQLAGQKNIRTRSTPIKRRSRRRRIAADYMAGNLHNRPTILP